MMITLTENKEVERHVAPTSSITLTKNTKGYGWEIKIYFDNTVRGARQRVLHQLEELDRQLREKYSE